MADIKYEHLFIFDEIWSHMLKYQIWTFGNIIWPDMIRTSHKWSKIWTNVHIWLSGQMIKYAHFIHIWQNYQIWTFVHIIWPNDQIWTFVHIWPDDQICTFYSYLAKLSNMNICSYYLAKWSNMNICSYLARWSNMNIC